MTVFPAPGPAGTARFPAGRRSIFPIMNLRALWLLLALALPCSPLCAAEKSDPPAGEPARPAGDEETMRMMRGHWALSQRAPDTSAMTVVLNLADDGRLTLEEEYKTDTDRVIRITKKGKWWVKDGVAYGDFTESSHPDIAPAGYTTKDYILRLDDKVMELRSSDGHLERWERNLG